MKITCAGALNHPLCHYWVSARGIVLDPGWFDGPHNLETARMVQRLYLNLERLG